jgi:hypothetical protein
MWLFEVGNAWTRHVLGVLSCRGGHVITKVSPQDCWILGRHSIIWARYRRSNAYNESPEEGEANDLLP